MGKNYLDDVLWGEIFKNNPKIALKPYKGCVWVPDIKGNRPYIDYSHLKPDKVAYKKFDIEPGELFFTKDELRHEQEDFIYIEPNAKNPQKDWGFAKWQEVVQALPYNFIQGKGQLLDGVEQVRTRSFRDACALLSRARLFVGTDGGLHHAAAALGIPAVVVWGGLVGPDILGYRQHRNLHSGTKSCGSLKPCEHCRQALAAITVEQVVNAINRVLSERPTQADEQVAALL